VAALRSRELAWPSECCATGIVNIGVLRSRLGSEGMRPPMRLRLAFAAILVLAAPACDLGQITVDTTAKVLARAQPALNQESDYQLAHDAIPATLKTVEGF